jgi:prolyl-tRNA synthetase
MRLSHLFGNTLREKPAEAESASHELLLRSGAIRRLAAGIYSYLPLGYRSIKKIEQIVREEMDAVGGQEMLMPVLHPAEIWQQSGRWYDIGPELFRLKDRNERDFVLAMTHEEVVTDLARREINSYRQLPFVVYHIQIKERDEARPRGGLLRVREFTMKDAYSFHADTASLDEYYPHMVQAYKNVFRRCGLPSIQVEADPGMMGGSGSHEFVVLSEGGEDTLVHCSGCDYVSNPDFAACLVPDAQTEGPMMPMEEVPTPGMKTIEGVSKFLGLPTSQTLKAVFYTADGKVVVFIIRGDLDVNENKIMRVLGTTNIHLSTEEELKNAGIVAGYASPVGMEGFRVIADHSVVGARNLVAGANKPDVHVKNANYGRDFKATEVADIAGVKSGALCPRCGAPVNVSKVIELGHVFKLGTKYSKSMGATFLDKDGEKKPLIMGCYGIGIGRLMAAVVEVHHDENGIIWPLSVAPFQVHIVALDMDNPDVSSAGEALYNDLKSQGYQVLYDDRTESAGVKFKDADLLGMPVRLTVSKRSLAQESFEVKLRKEEGFQLVKKDEIRTAINGLLAGLAEE